MDIRNAGKNKRPTALCLHFHTRSVGRYPGQPELFGGTLSSGGKEDDGDMHALLPCRIGNTWFSIAQDTIAMTRKGLPEPPTIFSGAAMTIAPVGGS